MIRDLRFTSIRETTSKLALELSVATRCAEALSHEEQTPKAFTRHSAYEVVFPRVVEYAKDYHTIEALTASGDGAFGIARVALSGSLSVQSVFLDTMLHVAGFMANMRGMCHTLIYAAKLGCSKSYATWSTRNNPTPSTVASIRSLRASLSQRT